MYIFKYVCIKVYSIFLRVETKPRNSLYIPYVCIIFMYGLMYVCSYEAIQKR